MKGSKRLDQIKEDNKKQLKKLFKYDKNNALSFSKQDREKVQDKFGVYVIFDKNTNICRSNWRIFNRLSTYYERLI